MNVATLQSKAYGLVKQYYFFIRYVAQRFWQDGCLYRAAALTYTSLLAMVPLLIVSFKILSVFPAFHDLGIQIQHFIFDNFVASSGKIIQSYLETFTQQATRLSIVGIIFLLVTAVMMMFTIEQALNDIWHVKIGRKGLSAFFRYWAILTLTPLLIGLSLVISSYVLSLPLFTGEQTEKNLLLLMPVVFTLIAFAVLYIGVPNCRVRILHGFSGAFFATLLFEVAKNGFTLYVQHFPTYSLLYGAFSAIPIFLIWVYLCWLIVLFGAEITHALGLYYQYTTKKRWDSFTQAFRWLGYFWQAQQRGQALTLSELVRQDERHYELEPDVMMQHLLQADLVEQTRTSTYFLKKDLTHFRLLDLYKSLPWRLPGKHTEQEYDPWQIRFNNIIDDLNTKIKPALDMPLAQLYETQGHEQ